MKLESQSKNNLPNQTGNRSEINKYWRSLWKCCKKPSDDIDGLVTQVQSVQVVPRVVDVVEEASEKIQEAEKQGNDGEVPTFLTPFSLGFTLNDSPKVIIWNDKQTWAGNSNSEVYYGLLEFHPVSIKKVPIALSKAAMNEARLLLKLSNHENVIRYLFPIVSRQNYFLVTDRYVTDVSLRSIDLIPQLLPTKEVLKQLINVTDYLHQQKILYLNFNPDNVHLVTRNGSAKVILTNFNCAIEISRDGEIVKVGNDFKGENGFIAPETMRNKKATASSDVFSLGCLFYYILTGDELPQISDQKKQVYKFNEMLNKFKTKANTYNDVLCIIMIKKMTNLQKVEKRPTAATIKKHPYFWETHEIFDLILQVTKRLEDNDDKEFKGKLELNKEQVFASNWKDKLELSVFIEVTKRRSHDPSSMSQLVFAIRNHFAHKCSPTLVDIMGTDEKLKDYWMGKFPRLIPHLCRHMNIFV